MECRKECNLKSCNCTELSCKNHGICCECIKHHRVHGELPACYFSKEAEATYNRSINNYIATMMKK